MLEEVTQLDLSPVRTQMLYTSTNNQHHHPPPPPNPPEPTQETKKKVDVVSFGISCSDLGHVVSLSLSIYIYAAAVILFHHNYPLRASKAIVAVFLLFLNLQLRRGANVWLECASHCVPRNTVG